jgi:valyl-tRNA synthetase
MKELAKVYDPQAVEHKWYKTWEEGKYFKPRPGNQQQSYTIIMPPPNVTGVLHMGHALDVTTQDALIRFKRMKGFEALWLPGMDHAGIATQSVVEKKVWNEEKKTRYDYSREEFVKKIWEWKEKHGGIIAKQQRGLGASPDWDYFMFTMDKEANEAVRKIFVDLYNEGLIYQADYIVNWDPVLQSAISDA